MEQAFFKGFDFENPINYPVVNDFNIEINIFPGMHLVISCYTIYLDHEVINQSWNNAGFNGVRCWGIASAVFCAAPMISWHLYGRLIHWYLVYYEFYFLLFPFSKTAKPPGNKPFASIALVQLKVYRTPFCSSFTLSEIRWLLVIAPWCLVLTAHGIAVFANWIPLPAKYRCKLSQALYIRDDSRKDIDYD